MSRQTDIPFERDQSTRFLPWIVAVMVFLATLATASAIAIGDTIESWDGSLTGRITIQVPAEDTEVADRTVTAILRLLNGMPEIAAAAALSASKVNALLEPWLGTSGGLEGLPVPRLIDVELVPGSGIDSDSLRSEIAAIDPAAAIDDHRVWLKALIDLARIVELVAFLVLLLIAVSAIAAVVFATQSGLAVHAAIIELLHLMGAQDGYVAHQFQAHAMWLGVRGGIIGSFAATAVLAAIGWVARGIEAAFLPSFTPSIGHALILAAVPAAAVAITMATARLTVIRALSRLP